MSYRRQPFLLAPHALRAPDGTGNLSQAADSGLKSRVVHSVLDDELGDLLRRVVTTEIRSQVVVWCLDDHAVGAQVTDRPGRRDEEQGCASPALDAEVG